MLAREKGELVMKSGLLPALECLRYTIETNPQHASELHVAEELISLAHTVYLARVATGSNGIAAQPLVRLYRTTLERIPAESTVQHVLVWPTYIMASECTLPEDRDFFTKCLLDHHERNGFHNILEGINHLKRIWSRSDEDWTTMLPEPRVFVM